MLNLKTKRLLALGAAKFKLQKPPQLVPPTGSHPKRSPNPRKEAQAGAWAPTNFDSTGGE
jgi:hypothetical protein